MSNFTKHISCDECGSSDANALYSDGSTFCFNCRTLKRDKEDLTQEDKEEVVPKKAIIAVAQQGAAPFRGMSKATLAKFNVTVGGEGDKLEAVYPFYDEDNRHIANKLRYKGKEFVIEGDWKKATLFGQQVFPAGSARQITITEGQDDAMAAFEMQGSNWPCVSVASSSSASKDVAKNFEYLNSFDKVVIAFDSDEPGKAAAAKVAAMFPPKKARIVDLRRAKDANEYLQKGLVKEFIKEWWDAPEFMPDGLKLGSDMWDQIKKPRKYETVSYPWIGLDQATYGIRLSEFVLVTAQTKTGKTQLLKECCHHIREMTKDKEEKPGLGFLFLEESNTDTCLGLMSIVANKPLHLPDVRQGVTEDELRGYFDVACNSDRIVMWDHFGSNSIEEVLSKIRHMHNLGCKYIILDHLSIIVSDQSGDERKQLDEISTKLKMMTMELGIAIIAVIHQNRNNQIRSSAGPEQIANITIKLHRDLEDPDEWRRNVTRVSVQYNRFCGTTGPVAYLFYQKETGRLIELDKHDIDRYENKKVAAVAQENWNDK